MRISRGVYLISLMVDCPSLLGDNHSVDFRWNYADNFGAVSKSATLTDWCLDWLCGSFRRASLPVHEIMLSLPRRSV